MSDHSYISTACYHFQHEACRLTCKFCDSRCECPCHEAEAIDPVLQEAIDAV